MHYGPCERGRMLGPGSLHQQRPHRTHLVTLCTTIWVLCCLLLAPYAAAQTTMSPLAVPTFLPQLQAADAVQGHDFTVQVTPPVVCESMNITFDPRKGVPPYSLMIAIEDWWPLVVDLPDTYDDPSKALWLYQFPVPTFLGATTNPNLIVSVVDSTGLMSNSSSLLQVQNNTSGDTCPKYAGGGDFIFYTELAASQCQAYDIFWKGDYTIPLELVFLPESAPPIYVPVAEEQARAGNMSWTVAMKGGTRFLLTMGDAGVKTGGVSKVNIVALNEYYSDTCIAQDVYAHNVLSVQTTAASASVFPDATSTLASLSTSNGVVATVTTIQTIRSGRPVQDSQGGLSSTAFLALMIVISLGVGIGGVAMGWFCFRRRQRRRQNIKSWDLPNNDPSVPFNANPNMPIAPGFLGREMTRQDSATVSERDGLYGPNLSAGGDSFSDWPSQQQHRGSLRSWTSGAWDQLQLATTGTSRNRSHAPLPDEYPLVNTISNPFSNSHAAIDRGAYDSHSRRPRTSDGQDSTSDSVRRPLDARADPESILHRAHSAGSRSNLSRSRSATATGNQSSSSSPSRTPGSGYADSTKSSRAGPGSTFRPDAASQAAYQDLLTSTTSPPGSMPSLTPAAYSSGDGRVATSGTSSDRLMQGQPNSRVIRHADAGLLLDDNADEDELMDFETGQVMELPPQYDTIHPAQRGTLLRQYRREQVQRRVAGSRNGSGDISDQRSPPSPVINTNAAVEPEEDESEFWNPVGRAH